MNTLRRLCLVFLAAVAVCPRPAAAQQIAFEDVVRNLRNPDPELRISAVRLLGESKYPEAMVPMAALVNDPVNEVQLEVLAAQLAFFLVDEVPPARRKMPFLGDGRADGRAARAFEMGPLAAWPKRPPSELVQALLDAVDDEHAAVRLEAVYTLGTIGVEGLAEEHAGQLTKALDHTDPAVREAAARVIGRLRVKSAADALVTAMNDANARVRHASMRALGEIKDGRAVKPLTEQFTFHGKGEGAAVALEALARIAHPSSVELFKSRLNDKDPFIRRAAVEGLGRTGYVSALEALQVSAVTDPSDMVRVATAFALQKQGLNYLSRLVDFLESDRCGSQAQAYLIELGPAIVPGLLPRLLEPGEGVRRRIVQVLGDTGDASTMAALAPLLQDSNPTVALAATNAVARIKMRTQ